MELAKLIFTELFRVDDIKRYSRYPSNEAVFAERLIELYLFDGSRQKNGNWVHELPL